MNKQLTTKTYIALLVPAVILIAGCMCQDHYRLYDGPPRSPEQVALLYGCDIEREVNILVVDGKAASWCTSYGAADIELLPGMHTVEIEYESSQPAKYVYGRIDFHSKFAFTVQFTAEAGKCYRPVSNVILDNKNYPVRWNPEIREIGYRRSALEKAAERGNAQAQYNLGKSYYYGNYRNGISRDCQQAYKWFSLAAQGEQDAVVYINLVKKELSAEQIAEAERCVREFKPKPEFDTDASALKN